QGIAHPGLDRLCEETGYCRRAVIDALDYLTGANPGQVMFIERLTTQHRTTSRYRVQGYAWFGPSPAINILEGGTTASG
ncbi:MAG: hypothetical protein ABT940_13260, partial [Alphaproteobacteria bacterium]